MTNLVTFERVNTGDNRARVVEELKRVGVTRRGLLRQALRYLPQLIYPSEHIQGAVYGRNSEGSVALIATDKRVLYIDKKPLFIDEDEIAYDVVSGVRYGRVGLVSSVVLHTRIQNYHIKTLNHKSAHCFVNYIEQRCLEPFQQRSYRT